MPPPGPPTCRSCALCRAGRGWVAAGAAFKFKNILQPGLAQTFRSGPPYGPCHSKKRAWSARPVPVTDTLLVGLGSSYRAVRTEARRPSLGLLLGPSPPAQVEFGKDRPLAAGSAQKHYPKTHSHRITGIVCHAGSGPRRAAGPRGGRCQCKHKSC